MLRVCSWHESRQGLIPLAGLSVTHFICAMCFTEQLVELKIMPSPKSPNWPSLLREGGWVVEKLRDKWPDYQRCVGGSSHQVQLLAAFGGSNQWVLFVDGHEVCAGDLSDCLERSNLVTPL